MHPLSALLVSFIVSVFHSSLDAGRSLNLAGGVRTDRGLSGNRLRWTWNVVEEMLIMGWWGSFVFVV
jgi:hypothetical protein